MNALIVVYSYHHMNTREVAKAMAEVLDAAVKAPREAGDEDLLQYDLVGFGAGIDSGRHYKEILDFARSIKENVDGKKCFIFSTSGVQGEDKVSKDHADLKAILKDKGFEILDEFSCKGFNTNSFLKFLGGMNRRHPDDVDLNQAKEFAAALLEKV